MSIEIFNKISGRYNTFKTASKNGLFENPNNFIIPNNVIISKKTKRVISDKTFKNQGLSINDVLFNKDKYLIDNASKKLVEKSKYYEKLESKQGKDFKVTGYSQNFRKLIISTETEAKFIVNKVLNFAKTIVENNRIKKQFQLVLFGKKQGDVMATSFASNYKLLYNDLLNKLISMLQQYQDYNFNVNKIGIRILKVNKKKFGAGEGGCTTYANLTIVSPNTKTNCLFTSWIIAENPENYYKPNIKDMSKQLKRNLKVNEDLSDFDTIQKLVNYKKRVCILLNENMQTIKEFKPTKDNKKESIKLQLANNHISACISTVLQQKEKPKVTNTIIQKKNYNQEYYNNFATWDIEAFTDANNNFKAYAIGLAYNNTYKSWFGLDCLSEFLDYIESNWDELSNYTFYAHNGGNFDFQLLINALSTYDKILIETNQTINVDNSYICLTITKNKISENKKIRFLDSFKILPSSLDTLSKEFKCENPKLEFNHNIIHQNNFREYKDKIEVYLKNDCLSLLEILNKFSKSVYESTGLNIIDCLTGASLAKKTFFKNYYNSKRPIYNLEKEQDKFIRQSFTGGRNEAFQLGEINGPIYYYDFTSLYPSTGKYPLPYNKPTNIEIKEDKILTVKDIENNFGFYEVLVKTINFNMKPLHGIKNKDGMLIFPHFNEFTKITLFSQEIKLGITNNQYQYKFIKGLKFDAAPFMCKYFNDAFNKKAEAKQQGNKALEQTYKIIANSGFGFWGTRNNRENTQLFNKSSSAYIPIANQNKLIDIDTIGNYTAVKYNRDLTTKDFNVAIASAIASYARCILFTAIQDIEKEGGKVYYTDTDSIICNLDISKSEYLSSKYKTGLELGSLKNECDEQLRKEGLEEGPNNYYDSLIILGCKFYALKKTLSNGKVIEVVKLNGYRKDYNLSYDLFFKLISKQIKQIEQNQKQFIKSNDNIKLISVNKSFKSNYKKGIVENNNISPLSI